MTQYKPFLIVNRLVVTKGAKRAYDESFKAGVNIIRGDNSSGKSTISDFIFYGLGGDLNKWKQEAASCDFVYVEASLSGSVYTLKRAIKESGRSSMDIFAGTFDAANSAENTGWIRYPYKADTKESFYQILFKELGIPYSKSEDKNSITMHQLLRMMYVDQMTSPDRLFKFDKFDSPTKRKAIGELLIGLSDFDLYQKRVGLQKLDAKLDNRVKEIQTIHTFLGSTVKSLAEIDSEIAEKQAEVDSLEKEVEQFSNESEDETTDDYIIQELADNVRNVRKEHAQISDQIAKNSFEISDSQLFIASLESRIEALTETRSTISALSDVAFIHCPACQIELVKKDTGCSVCGTEQDDSESNIDPTFKVRKEIEFQIEESKKLIDIRQDRLGKLRLGQKQAKTKLEELERELTVILKPQRTVSVQLRRKLNEIGSLRSQISALNSSKEEFGKLYNLYEEREAIQAEVSKLRTEIKRLEAKQDSEITRKKYQLATITREIIRADSHEEIFTEGQKIEFDFGEDRVTIDDRALFSASSMVYLKNAFRLAMLKASCLESSYLYPRFLLMDNVEDKGMQHARSQQFQREIISVSESLPVEHQIIFTTSMIAPELDASDYCVGDFYDDDNKTLKV